MKAVLTCILHKLIKLKEIKRDYLDQPGAIKEETQEVEVDKQEKEATPLQSIFLSLMCSRLDFLYILLSHWYCFSIFAFAYLDVNVAGRFYCTFVKRINAMQMSLFAILFWCF